MFRISLYEPDVLEVHNKSRILKIYCIGRKCGHLPCYPWDLGAQKKYQLAVLPWRCISPLFKIFGIGAGRLNTDLLVLTDKVYWNQIYWCGVFSPTRAALIKCRCHLKRASFPMNSESVTQGIDWSVLPSAWLGPLWSCPCDPIFRAHRHLHFLTNSISKWQDGGGWKVCVSVHAGKVWQQGGKIEWFCILVNLCNQYNVKSCKYCTPSILDG